MKLLSRSSIQRISSLTKKPLLQVLLPHSKLCTSAATWKSSHNSNAGKSPRPRLPGLTAADVPSLEKLDPYLDFEGGHFDARFPETRPDVVISSQTENDNEMLSALTGLTLDEIANLQKRALVIKRVVNMTAKGKLPSMYTLVVVGNGEGVAGYGEGKHEEVIMAIRKATNQAIKNLQFFERYDDRTLYHDISHKFHATRLMLWARPPGFGLRVNHNIHEICKCIGIQDLSGKVFGSTNSMNVIKATFEALANQRLPQDIARQRGKKLVDVQHTYYGVPKHK
ncbi:hypothetical protein G9A89_015005 [Geosiphon pyriformis]|nr:hypothetical protein G9A89_015005 [Geosiphon pyriformis]